MDNIIIKQFLIGMYEVNSYLVACPQTKEAVVIDPAGEEEKLLSLIEQEGVTIKYILNTHGHADHVMANQRLKKLLKKQKKWDTYTTQDQNVNSSYSK